MLPQLFTRETTFVIWYVPIFNFSGLTSVICFVVAKWLAFMTLDQEVLGSNSRWNSVHDYMALLCTEPFIIILLSSRYDLNNTERNVKYQTIIIIYNYTRSKLCLWGGMGYTMFTLSIQCSSVFRSVKFWSLLRII